MSTGAIALCSAGHRHECITISWLERDFIFLNADISSSRVWGYDSDPILERSERRDRGNHWWVHACWHGGCQDCQAGVGEYAITMSVSRIDLEPIGFPTCDPAVDDDIGQQIWRRIPKNGREFWQMSESSQPSTCMGATAFSTIPEDDVRFDWAASCLLFTESRPL
jgi:hypothetical protein